MKCEGDNGSSVSAGVVDKGTENVGENEGNQLRTHRWFHEESFTLSNTDDKRVLGRY